ncbi:MAG TPA: RraA family protein [Alphaproteobacteria bacterium]|jgi:regulator of RNase E activity RraA|nr:RraA family protein [Alphaproteobacteria bacterium]MDP6271624.1 RraA family protein [Alphaproteobacteria bacterium]MDP7164053.1 RraA family protein [Alphaproteobacteria bacterium]MDP7426676.1 RraA family protein [Alphaproteobacteria bacterium]HJM49145.1 RraA family protein [Alphaproteobacteria bacterium]
MTGTGDPDPPPELIARLAPLATSTLANALDEVGLPDNVAAGVAAVAPGLRCAGPALTVKEVSGDFATFASSDFKVGAVIEAARAGDVIVIDAGGARVSTWGGMASYAASLKGIAGLVVDGGVRDLEEIVEFGFAVFARHLVPTTGRTRLKVEAIGEPIEIGGVGVAPGDLVVADGTGVVCLPAPRAAEIVTLAERFATDDAAAMADLEAGMTFVEVMDKYRKI